MSRQRKDELSGLLCRVRGSLGSQVLAPAESMVSQDNLTASKLTEFLCAITPADLALYVTQFGPIRSCTRLLTDKKHGGVATIRLTSVDDVTLLRECSLYPLSAKTYLPEKEGPDALAKSARQYIRRKKMPTEYRVLAKTPQVVDVTLYETKETAGSYILQGIDELAFYHNLLALAAEIHYLHEMGTSAVLTDAGFDGPKDGVWSLKLYKGSEDGFDMPHSPAAIPGFGRLFGMADSNGRVDVAGDEGIWFSQDAYGLSLNASGDNQAHIAARILWSLDTAFHSNEKALNAAAVAMWDLVGDLRRQFRCCEACGRVYIPRRGSLWCGRACRSWSNLNQGESGKPKAV